MRGGIATTDAPPTEATSRTTLPLVETGPRSPAWREAPYDQPRETMPVDIRVVGAVLPFRAPVVPEERREIPPPASGVRVVRIEPPPVGTAPPHGRRSWPARVAVALGLVLYTVAMIAFIERRITRASTAVGEPTVPASAVELVAPSPLVSLAPTWPVASVASAEPPRAAPSASAPAVRVKAQPPARPRPAQRVRSDVVQNPWGYE
jgi:hypothetical protein